MTFEGEKAFLKKENVSDAYSGWHNNRPPLGSGDGNTILAAPADKSGGLFLYISYSSAARIPPGRLSG